MRFFRPELERTLKAAGGLRELARETNFLVNLDRGGSTCARLRQLGLDLETRR